MEVAILDVGSNNIKLEVHEVDNTGNARLLYADKVEARLGHEVFITHRLQPENEARAIEGLSNFSKIIRNFNCKAVIAVGTAALRETDHKDFIRRAYKECGIQVKVIPGVEEARLVYLGVLAHTKFQSRDFLFIDIGGGSTEVSIANENGINLVESFRLGTVRLKELFENEDRKKSLKMIESYVQKVIHPFVYEAEDFNYDMGMLTGGTSRNLADIVSNWPGEKVREENGNLILETAALKRVVSEITGYDISELKKVKGLDSARADIILPGAILLITILESFKIKESIVSSYGLRDGALYNYIEKKVNKKIYFQRQGQSRKHGVDLLAKKFNVEKEHARQCSQLSLRLFEILQGEHGLSEEYEDIMYGASLLHDSGIFIDYSQHHKHSYYLIKNSELPGFSSHEKNLVALVARYHRKGMPKKSHAEFQSLQDEEKSAVTRMASILRIADALDRSYTSAVKSLELLNSGKEELEIAVSGKGDLSLELWSVDRKKKFFEETFKKQLKLRVI